MSAKVPQRRGKSASELAEQFGISTRQVRRLAAEPREKYLARAAAQREYVVRLREQGLSYKQIAETTGLPIGTVGRVLNNHRNRQARAQSDQSAEEKKES